MQKIIENIRKRAQQCVQDITQKIIINFNAVRQTEKVHGEIFFHRTEKKIWLTLSSVTEKVASSCL